MDRALVIVDDSETHRRLLREAGELAAGVGAELVLLSLLTEDEFEDDFETIETIGEAEGMGYDTSDVLESAETAATNLANEVIGHSQVEFTSVGAVVEEDAVADRILDVAETHDCDHVFISGRRRSPTGKAIFGDTAQAVILNFDGPVTVITS